MYIRNYDKNIRPFRAICDCSFGRKVIYTNATKIDETNIVSELDKALVIHNQNAEEIDYLDRYYRGDQPILYRAKKIRPEVNHKVVVNLAKKAVDTHTAEIAGEPIQYVLRGTDEKKSQEITDLNKMMDGEDKEENDIELCRWRSICGTAYRFVGKNETDDKLLDESAFWLSVEEPNSTFVAYYADNKKPAFSCQIRKDTENNKLYFIYTNSLYFIISKGQIIEQGPNGNGAIPVIEYPNNSRRLSDIEITISITDEINAMASDRGNGIEQFVSAWIKFVNCEIDSEEFEKMRDMGALQVKSNNAENKAEVDVMTSELNQTQTQVAMDDLVENFLVVQGMPNRQGNGGADTGSAVERRNGHFEAEQMAEIVEPIFKKAERAMLRIVLKRLKTKKEFSLMPSDIEIKISRSKSDNMLTKAECLQILLACGVAPERAIKTVNLFSDPEQVAVESADRMAVLYPTTPTKGGDTPEDKDTDTGKDVVNNGNITDRLPR